MGRNQINKKKQKNKEAGKRLWRKIFTWLNLFVIVFLRSICTYYCHCDCIISTERAGCSAPHKTQEEVGTWIQDSCPRNSKLKKCDHIWIQCLIICLIYNTWEKSRLKAYLFSDEKDIYRSSKAWKAKGMTMKDVTFEKKLNRIRQVAFRSW